MHHAAHKHGKAVLMVTHDPEEVKDFADRNIHLLKDKMESLLVLICILTVIEFSKKSKKN